MRIVYVEEAVAVHPRARSVLSRLGDVQVIACERYGEVFNPSRQSFGLQKKKPALILAAKPRGHVLPTPEGYGVGGRRNYYFSHMLNCPYDCRYCFLQGMFRSAHYVLFVNYEDMQAAIDRTLQQAPDDPEVWFFSGYDCDSLAFEAVSGFVEAFLPFFGSRPRARLELRTKSVRIAPLLEREPLANVVVAFSLSPGEVAKALEHGAPSLERRLEAIARLQERGWRVGLRIDPLIYFEGWREAYGRFFECLSDSLQLADLHSVSLGSFRLPRDFHRRLIRHYPQEPFLSAPLEEVDGLVSYRQDVGDELFSTCRDLLLERIPEEIYFPCLSG